MRPPASHHSGPRQRLRAGKCGPRGIAPGGPRVPQRSTGAAPAPSAARGAREAGPTVRDTSSPESTAGSPAVASRLVLNGLPGGNPMADRHAEKRGYLQSTPLIGRAAVGRTCSQSPCQPSAPCRMRPSIHVAGLHGRVARQAVVLGERVVNPAAGHVRVCCGREWCIVVPPWRQVMSEADGRCTCQAPASCKAMWRACLPACMLRHSFVRSGPLPLPPARTPGAGDYYVRTAPRPVLAVATVPCISCMVGEFRSVTACPPSTHTAMQSLPWAKASRSGVGPPMPPRLAMPLPSTCRQHARTRWPGQEHMHVPPCPPRAQ